MIDFLRAFKPRRHVVAGLGDRISVLIQLRCQKTCFGIKINELVIASKESGHTGTDIVVLVSCIQIRTEIDHFHGNAVLLMIDGRDCCQFIIYRNILDNGKIETVRFRNRAGYDHTGCCVGLQAGICIASFIPCYDRSIILSLAAAVEVDAEKIIGKNLISGKLRCKELFRILIIEIIEVIGLARSFPVMLNETPQHGIQSACNPFDGVAAFVAAHQTAIMVDRIEFVFSGLTVPYTGIDDNTGTIRNCFVGNADFSCGILHKIGIVQF